MDSKNEKFQNLQSQLSAALKSMEDEIREKDRIEQNLKIKISNLENELIKQKEQDEIVDKMMKLEVATKQLDKMTDELNQALNLKDLEMADLLKLQSETERKLEIVQTEVSFNFIRM